MIDADFSTAHAAATVALNNNWYWDLDYVPLTVEHWKDFAAILAPVLSWDAWAKVCHGVDAVGNLNSYRTLDAGELPDRLMFPPLSKELKEGVARAVDDLYKARAALAPICFEEERTT